MHIKHGDEVPRDSRSYNPDHSGERFHNFVNDFVGNIDNASTELYVLDLEIDTYQILHILESTIANEVALYRAEILKHIQNNLEPEDSIFMVEELGPHPSRDAYRIRFKHYTLEYVRKRAGKRYSSVMKQSIKASKDNLEGTDK